MPAQKQKGLAAGCGPREERLEPPPSEGRVVVAGTSFGLFPLDAAADTPKKRIGCWGGVSSGLTASAAP